MEKDIDVVIDKTEVQKNGGCHDWLGGFDEHGEPVFESVDNPGEVVNAKVVVWEYENRKKLINRIPENTCGNQGCVNPNHFKSIAKPEPLVTAAESMRRMRERKRYSHDESYLAQVGTILKYPVWEDERKIPMVTVCGKTCKATDFAWEIENGPMPPRAKVIPKDGDKYNFGNDNLDLLLQKDQRRLAEGWVRKDGKWVAKICDWCNELLPFDKFYHTKYRYQARYCKKCVEGMTEGQRKARHLSRFEEVPEPPKELLPFDS